MQSLRTDPFIGDPCGPPLTGVWRIHFASDKHRLAWLVHPDIARVDVLAAGPKTPTFYDRVHDRLSGALRDLTRRLASRR